MASRVLDFGAFSIAVADGWENITATLGDADAPLTLADEDSGVGALQFSPALYQGGKPPRIGPEALRELLDDFASRRGLGEPVDRSNTSDMSDAAGASFHSGEDFVRVWYVSDGWSVILVTYVCEWASRHQEFSEVERFVRSIRFPTTRPESP